LYDDLRYYFLRLNNVEFVFFGYRYKIINGSLYFQISISKKWIKDDLSLWSNESINALKSKLYALTRGC
jgi:hypothetical protein